MPTTITETSATGPAGHPQLSVAYDASRETLSIRYDGEDALPAPIVGDLIDQILQYSHFEITGGASAPLRIGIVRDDRGEWSHVSEVVVSGPKPRCEIEVACSDTEFTLALIGRGGDGKSRIIGTISDAGDIALISEISLDEVLDHAGHRHRHLYITSDTAAPTIIGLGDALRHWTSPARPDPATRAWTDDERLTLIDALFSGQWFDVPVAPNSLCLFVDTAFAQVTRQTGPATKTMSVMQEAGRLAEQGIDAVYHIGPDNTHLITGMRAGATGSRKEIVVAYQDPGTPPLLPRIIVFLPWEWGLPLEFLAQAFNLIGVQPETAPLLCPAIGEGVAARQSLAFNRFMGWNFGLKFNKGTYSAVASGTDTLVQSDTRTYRFDAHGDLAWVLTKNSGFLVKHTGDSFVEFHQAARAAGAPVDRRHLDPDHLDSVVITKNSVQVRNPHPLDDAVIDTIYGRLVCRRAPHLTPAHENNVHGWCLFSEKAYQEKDVLVAHVVIENDALSITTPKMNGNTRGFPFGVRVIIGTFAGSYIIPLMEATQLPPTPATLERFKLKAEDLPAPRAQQPKLQTHQDSPG